MKQAQAPEKRPSAASPFTRRRRSVIRRALTISAVAILLVAALATASTLTSRSLLERIILEARCIETASSQLLRAAEISRRVREVQLADDRTEQLRAAFALRSVLVAWTQARQEILAAEGRPASTDAISVERDLGADVARALARVDTEKRVSVALRRRIDADAEAYTVVERNVLDRQRLLQLHDQSALELTQRIYAVAVVGVMILLALFAVAPALRRASRFLEDLAREDEADKRRATELALAAIFEQSRTGVALLDQHGTILQCNAALTETLGAGFEVDALVSYLNGGSHRFEIELAPVDGRRRIADAGISPVARLHDGSRSFLLVLEEITERREIEERLQHDASHDSLTNIENRKAMRVRIAEALRGSGGYLVLIDLDNFKIINDTFGHIVGDDVLIEVAQRLKRELSAVGTAGRIGGDEFVAVIQVGDDAALGAVLGDLLEQIAKPISTFARPIAVTASIGATALKSNGSLGLDEAMRAADLALYRAKSLGRNRFAIGAHDALTTRDAFAHTPSDIRDGLTRGEFFLEYQPIVDARTGAYIALEALVRWNRGGLGIVPPAEFIDIAERSGAIVPLGAWILTEACAEFAQLSAELPTCKQLHVNVSALQIAQDDFVRTVQAALEAAHLPAEQLVLEATEGTLVRYSPDDSSMLDRICALGVRWCIDDFGVGYSSLAYLNTLPVASLKIDRSFVSADRVNGLANGVIVNAVLQLGRSLNINVIAEGVEHSLQERALCAMGALMLQGFLFSRPVSAARLHVDARRERADLEAQPLTT